MTAPNASDTVRWPTLFVAFSLMALSGFGGVMPFAYRALVERRRWLSDRDFASGLAISQMLPGPTVLNLAVIVGWRYDGLAGACAAFAGVLAGPFLLILAIGYGYAHVSGLPVVQHALAGMSAVAAGLILALAIKMAIGLVKAQPSRGRLLLAVLFAALAFAGVGLLRWPLISVAAVLAPLAILTFRVQPDTAA